MWPYVCARKHYGILYLSKELEEVKNVYQVIKIIIIHKIEISSKLTSVIFHTKKIGSVHDILQSSLDKSLKFQFQV